MKQLVFFFALLLAFSANTQTPFMVCKPGGYSDLDLKNFLFEEDQDGNLVLKQTRFVENYANQSVRIINEGYDVCGKDYKITTEDLVWVIDNSHIENLEMKSFFNSKKIEDEIIFYRDTFTGGVRIHEYDGCRVAWMKDTCANLIEYRLPKLPKATSAIVQNKKPEFVVGDDTAPNGGKSPDVSGDVAKNTEPEKKDTLWIPEVGPIVTSSGKKPTSWQEQEYERQQQKEKQQGTKPDFDSLSFLSNGGNYISNSFNTTNTYVFPGGSQSQDESDGQYVYSRGSWVPASYVSDYGGPRVRLYAGLRVAYGVSNYPPYCPSGLPYDGYWDGHYYRSALDGRTLAQDNRGNWQYQGGPSPNVDYSVLNQNRYKPETTGYTSNSYHPSTHNGGYYGPRRF